MDKPSIDLAPLRRALGVLTEALTLWHAQPVGVCSSRICAQR